MTKKTIVLSLICLSSMFAQQKAEINSWIVDPAYVKNSVYAVNVGRNTYESFLRSLVGLSEKLRMTRSKILPNAPVNASSAHTFTFGNTSITYLKRSFRGSTEKRDSLNFQSTISMDANLLFSDGVKKCFITIGSDAVELANDETFNGSAFDSKTRIEQSLSYGFTRMSFSDLLAELEGEGVKVNFKTEYDVVYALATFPLSKVKQ